MRPPASLIDALTSLRKVIFVSVIITSHFKQLKQRTKATPNTISLALYLRCLTYFFQVPHYILHVCVWSATLCFSCWHVPLCCRSVQWLGTHPDAGCSFLWALPHVLHQTQDIQWTQYVFCLFSAHSLLFAFVIGRIHIIQWTQYVVCLFSAHFAFRLYYWEDTHHTVNPVCLLFIFCSLFAFCLCYWPTGWIQWTQYVFCLFSALSLLFAFIIGRGCLHAANEHLLLHSHTYRLCVDHCCMQLFLTIGRFGASLCVG